MNPLNPVDELPPIRHEELFDAHAQEPSSSSSSLQIKHLAISIILITSLILITICAIVGGVVCSVMVGGLLPALSSCCIVIVSALVLSVAMRAMSIILCPQAARLCPKLCCKERNEPDESDYSHFSDYSDYSDDSDDLRGAIVSPLPPHDSPVMYLDIN